MQAASILATGEKTTCAPAGVEAYVTHFADADYELTGLAWKRYIEKAPKGWARYEALAQDGNEIFLFNRSP